MTRFMVGTFALLYVLTACGDLVEYPETEEQNPAGIDLDSGPWGEEGSSAEFNPTGCARKAAQYGFSKSLAVSLCRNGSLQTAECGHYAQASARFSFNQAVELCMDGGTKVTAQDCAHRAIYFGFGYHLALQLCKKGGNRATSDCAKNATQVNGLSYEQAVSLCDTIR